MLEDIDHISVNDSFWVQLKPHLISFGFKGLPDNVHLTISFHENSPDINLHVTKNSLDPKDKPKIRVVYINKNLLKELQPLLIKSLLNLMLEPIDINQLKNEYENNLYFIPNYDLQHRSFRGKLLQRLKNSFQAISYFKRKKRLKIDGDIAAQLRTAVRSRNLLWKMRKRIVRLSAIKPKRAKNGFIITKDKTIPIFHIAGKSYTIKQNLTPIDMLNAFVPNTLSKQLIYKAKRAIVRVKNSTSFNDTAPYDSPIRLIRTPTKQR